MDFSSSLQFSIDLLSVLCCPLVIVLFTEISTGSGDSHFKTKLNPSNGVFIQEDQFQG